MGKLRRKLSFANVTSLLALFVALATGGAYAADQLLEKNDVKSKHIKDGGVKTKDIADNAVTSPKVANGSLLSEDFAVGQLPAGPQGERGPVGPEGRSALSTLQAGETVRGIIGWRGYSESAGQVHIEFENLPIPAPVALDEAHILVQNINVHPNDQVCTGSNVNPTAPPGFLCIYLIDFLNVDHVTGYAPGLPSRFGFGARWTTGDSGPTGVQASWAYTAP